MPAFDAEVLRATRVVDHLFAEPWVLRPYAAQPDRTAPAAPDSTRDVVQLCGVFIDRPGDPREPNAYDPREYRRPGLASGEPRVEFAAHELQRFCDFSIREGDHLDRLENRTSYLVRSVFVTPNGTARITLNELGKTP